MSGPGHAGPPAGMHEAKTGRTLRPERAVAREATRRAGGDGLIEVKET